MATPKFKLYYFNLAARGEVIRLIFAYAKVPYEDIRISQEEWPQRKKEMPFGSMPVLSVDGKMLSQSRVIMRYLARKFGLAPENEFDIAKCDEIVDAMVDVKAAVMKARGEQDSAVQLQLRTKIIDETFPTICKKLNDLLIKGNGFLVGQKITYADIFVFNWISIFQKMVDPNILNDFRKLQVHQETIANMDGIKQWLSTRPATPY